MLNTFRDSTVYTCRKGEEAEVRVSVLIPPPLPSKKSSWRNLILKLSFKSIPHILPNRNFSWSKYATSGSRIWSRGGPRNFFRDFADVAKQSRVSEARQYWPGSRARLRALEALAFLTVKYAFSHFS